MVTFISLTLFVAALSYTLFPLMAQRVAWLDEADAGREQYRGLEAEKRVYLKALKDIDFERASDKINVQDYEDLRAHYRHQVSVLLAQQQALEVEAESAEADGTDDRANGEAEETLT